MIRFNSLNALAILFGLAIILVTCKSKSDDPQPPQTTEQEKVTQLLTSGTGIWTPPVANGITVAGIDVTEELFKGFTIRFTATQIITTGTTPVWLRQDTWQFKSGSSTIIIRGQDDKEVTIKEIDDTRLKLILEWDETTFEGGRTKSLPGTYEFVMNK